MEVEIIELPEPSTTEMKALLHGVLRSAVDQLAEIVPFHTGDVMSAAMTMIVETGLEGEPPEKLRATLVEVLDALLASYAAQKEKSN